MAEFEQVPFEEAPPNPKTVVKERPTRTERHVFYHKSPKKRNPINTIKAIPTAPRKLSSIGNSGGYAKQSRMVVTISMLYISVLMLYKFKIPQRIADIITQVATPSGTGAPGSIAKNTGNTIGTLSSTDFHKWLFGTVGAWIMLSAMSEVPATAELAQSLALASAVTVSFFTLPDIVSQYGPKEKAGPSINQLTESNQGLTPTQIANNNNGTAQQFIIGPNGQLTTGPIG